MKIFVCTLLKEIQDKKKLLEDMETNCKELSTALDKALGEIAEKDKLCQGYTEEMRKMQCIVDDHSARINQENQLLKSALESQRKELEQWAEELERREAEVNLKRMVFSEKILERKLSIIGGKVSGAMDIEDDNTFNIQQNMDALIKELEEKTAEVEYMTSINHTLLVKERKSNIELQEARVALISGFEDFLSNRANAAIGVKRMGELNGVPFLEACFKKLSPSGEWEVKSAELCSSWQEEIRNAEWHPFKISVVDGKFQEIVDETDEKLKALKHEWGDAVYDAVAQALKEMNEYNASGRYAVPELWNFKEEKKVSLKEVIGYILKQLKTLRSFKRRRL